MWLPGEQRTSAPILLARSTVSVRPNDSTWSPLEYAAHVRDVMRVYRERLRLMVETDDPLYPNWDQDLTAVEEDYRGQEPGAVAAQLFEAAARLAESFDAVRGEQWQRRGRRSDGASFTIAGFGRYMIHDPLHHLYDVTGERAG